MLDFSILLRAPSSRPAKMPLSVETVAESRHSKRTTPAEHEQGALCSKNSLLSKTVSLSKQRFHLAANYILEAVFFAFIFIIFDCF